MDLQQITPLILTFNEAPNIRRVLDRLTWAQTVLIVDSFSTDETLQIVREFPNVKVVQRPFDHFADQCNFGLQNVATRWTLSLDADYLCPVDFSEELAKLADDCAGYRASFRYCVYSRPLRATLYPPRVVLYQTAQAAYVRDGHAHKVNVNGDVKTIRSVIDHDDHKPLPRWLKSQSSYASMEADKILGTEASKLGWKDRLRQRLVIAPVLTVFYCLLARLLILDGWPGIYYTIQRVYAELLLSLELLDRRLKPRESIDRAVQPRENAKAAV